MRPFTILLTLAGLCLLSPACRKKDKPEPDSPLKPLTEVLPGIWNTTTYKATAEVELSGVKYELIRSIKNGQLKCVVNGDASQLHFEGQGTFETSIRIAGQDLQTTEQFFGFSEQNASYQIVGYEKNKFDMVRKTGNTSVIAVQVARDGDNKLKFTFQEQENIENLGMILFTYEYSLLKEE